MEIDKELLDLKRALLSDKVILDLDDPYTLEKLKEERDRISEAMERGSGNPPMLWSGIPFPKVKKKGDLNCEYQLVISIGGTKTEYSLMRLKEGELLALDLKSGEEIKEKEKIKKLIEEYKMDTPRSGARELSGENELIKPIVNRIYSSLKRIEKRCNSILLNWAFPHRVIRTSEKVIGGVSAKVIKMTKDQRGFSKDLKDKDLAKLFKEAFRKKFGDKLKITVANDTIMSLHYFLTEERRKRFNQIGLFIIGTGTNFAIAEKYAVRTKGYVSEPGEEYLPDRITKFRVLQEREKEMKFFVNYEIGSLELKWTRTIYDTEDDYQIERNTLAGGNAFSQQFRGLVCRNLSPGLYEIIRTGREARKLDPELEASDIAKFSNFGASSLEEINYLLGGINLDPITTSKIRFIADKIIERSALHAALVLAAITSRISFGLGNGSKSDLLGMEGSVWKTPGYKEKVFAFWMKLAEKKLNIEFDNEPDYNASLYGPVYMAALQG